MRIAVIAPTEIPARRANTIQVLKMTQAIVALGHKVRLASPFNPYHREISEEKAWKNLSHYYGLKHQFDIDWLTAIPQFRSYDYSLRAISWARNWKSDILYTRLPQAAAFASFLGIPTIFELHDLPQGKIGPCLFRLFLHGKGATRLVVITDALARDLERNFRTLSAKSITIILPDGVDLDRYENLPSPAEARKKLIREGKISRMINSPEDFTIGYTGHLYPGRGSDLLLRLASILPEVLFLIAGGEPTDIERLREEVTRQDLGNIILTGFIPNSELPLYQAACDVLLMPYQEQVAASSGGDIARYLSPMKLFEYLACGRAIISSNLPVLQEVLNLENAILVPPDKLQAWKNAIIHLKNNPNTMNKLANQARQDAHRYTWERRSAQILDGLS